jgi:hypothetical protein
MFFINTSLKPYRELDTNEDWHPYQAFGIPVHRIQVISKMRFTCRGRIAAVRQTADLVYGSSILPPGSIFLSRVTHVISLFSHAKVMTIVASYFSF